ncbi:MBL fold metallo-hydrolase [candidate division KSB1 bacterium]
MLNTHYHSDHTGGNEILGKSAPIIAHANNRKRLVEEPDFPEGGLQDITFDDKISIHFNEEEIKAVHFPHGHTDGDLVIFFTGSNVVHMGDDFAAGGFPYVDLEAGGSVEGLKNNIANVIEQLPPDVKIIPGHGPVSSLEDLKTYHRMLVETIDVVTNRIRAGIMDLEQIKAAGLPDRYNDWGSGFITTERWIETIYNSYSR